MGVHKCEFQGVVSGRRVRLYVFLTACIGPGVSTDGTGAPGGQQRSDSGSANGTANFYITGNTFMLVDGEPCTTTQLQQPLDTLVWAAGLLPGADSSSSSPSSSNSRRSDMQEAPGGSSVAKEQRRKLTASRREEDEGDSGSTSSAAAAHEPEAALLAEATRALVSGSQGVLTLRSRLSGTAHPLRLAVHEPHKWRNNPSLRREPGRVTGALVLTPQELQAVARGSDDSSSSSSSSSSGSSSQGGGASTLFELRAAGLDGVCGYTPRRGKRPPPPASAAPIHLTSRVPIDSPATAGDRQDGGNPGSAGMGAPRCAWLDPERQVYDVAKLEAWREKQRVSAALAAAKKRKGKDRGAVAASGRASPPPPPPAPRTGTGARPPAYVVVSPFFGLAPGDFVTLLLRHVEYHAQLGVGRHLVYVEEGEEGLAADGRVAALMAAGRLELVRWSELPVFNLPAAAAAPQDGTETGASGAGGSDEGPRRHPYASQILTYNHALLALWHEAAVVAVLDLDEFLVTSSPQSLEAAMRACSPRGRYPPGALWVPRRSLLCTDCWQHAAGPAQALGAAAAGAALKAAFPEAQLRNATLAAEASILERRLWLEAGGQEEGASEGNRAGKGHDHDNSGGSSGGSQGHPLESYRHWFLGWHHKSVMYSHLVTYFGVHLAYIEEEGAGQGPNEGGQNPHTICRLGCMWVTHLETQLGPRVRSPLEALAQYNSGKGEAEKRNAGGGGGGGKKQKVTAVEGRYLWALQRWLGRPVAGRSL